jgi:hypothetical protein
LLLRRRPPPETAPEPVGAAAEVQLCVMIAPAVRAKVRAVAKARGLTLRALVLSALRDAGVLEEFGDAEFVDRRATLAAARAQLWREHVAAASDTSAPPAAPPPAVRKFGSGDT